ncbi:tryptophan synthase subunit alpha [Alteromonadaceae bacterium BrNp21-10]|nr:tryptophan synthase subunit alpha [Alteromonadaceae bacterium BrNp21-10]
MSNINRYAALFEKLANNNEGAFVPFVMLGDPDLETSYKIICTLVDNGADALELGFPYSDPIADGPTIQKASIRALSHHFKTADSFAVIARVRAKYPDVAIGLLLYSNLVFRRGIETFYAEAKQAGVDSILLADVPLREGTPFRTAAEANGIKQILIAPPNANDEDLAAIAKQTQGYTYLLGRAGVTGAEATATTPVHEMVMRLKQNNAAPAVIGFGISTPEHVKAAISAGADGAIAGSATVNIIEKYLDDVPAMLQALGEFVSVMKAATR